MSQAERRDRTVDQIASFEAMIEGQIQELQELREQLRSARNDLASTDDAPSAEWMARFGRYLTPEFQEEVTTHFHDAKRAALTAARGLKPSASP